MNALFRFIQTELNEIPNKGQARIQGTAIRVRSVASDKIEWLCKPGQGILTTAAEGNYRTTLMLHPQTPTSRVYDLGLRRRSVDATGNEWSDKDWWPLIRDVAELEISYWDSRVNTKLEQWKDPNVLPILVSISIKKTKNSSPQTSVMTVAAAQIQQ